MHWFKSRSFGVFLALTSILLTVALAAVASEAVVRHRERNRDSVPGVMPFLYYRHERLRHALVRDHDYYQWVHVNKHGFRGADVEIKKPPGLFRIIVVGGSTVFDTGVTRDDRAWPARMERWLECLAPGTDVQVINAGVPGYVMMDNLIRLQAELYEFQPDLLILYQAHNDLIAALHRIHEGYRGMQRPRQIQPVAPWTQWLGDNSLLYTKLKARLKILQRQGTAANARATQSASIYEQSVTAGAARHAKDLRSFLAVASAFGIPVVVPEILHADDGAPLKPGSEMHQMWLRAVGVPPLHLLNGYAQYEAVSRQVATERGALYMPTKTFDLQSLRWYADGDPVHFNDAGADRMAARMAQALIEGSLITGAKRDHDVANGPLSTCAANPVALSR
jgi:lysophospholipase L1-like esterase